MYDKSQDKGKRLGDTDEEERWRQSDKTQRTARAKFAKGGMVSAYDKAKQEKEQVDKETEDSRKKSGLRFTASFKKGGMVGRDYCK